MKDKDEFFGREDLIGQLDELWAKRVPSLVTCRGRRRVGKSTLIEEFARRSGAAFIKLDGLRPKEELSDEDERAFFATKLAAQVRGKVATPANWYEAFVRLGKCVNDRKRTVILLDEISWMAYYSPSFPEVLKSAWDDVFKKHPKLILVLCGSVSHWISKNIIGNSAYVGRRSLDMVVPELPLSECVKFWGKKASRIDAREIIDVLSVTGGVPCYLEEVNPSLSAVENIRRLCFAPQSLLRMEFEDMFNDVVTAKPKFSAKVLRTFVDGPKSGAEVAKILGVDTGGDISLALSVLQESGFLAEECTRNPETGEPARERRYRLKDNYTRFYLKFIEPHKAVIDEGAFDFPSLADLDGIDSVLGLAFENLVVNNYRDLLPLMHLTGTLITAAGPFRRRAAKSKRGKPGVQVDLLLQTRRSLWFVEVKRKREIDREIEAEVERKVKALSRPDGVSSKTALVYDGHLSPLVSSDGYFDAVIPFRKLLGLQ